MTQHEGSVKDTGWHTLTPEQQQDWSRIMMAAESWMPQDVQAPEEADPFVLPPNYDGPQPETDQ